MWRAAARPVHDVLAWPVRSQHGARRNALVASTALAVRRRERLDAEEFLAAYLAEREERGERLRPA